MSRDMPRNWPVGVCGAIVLIALIEPLTHAWIACAPPPGMVPTGVHTGDSAHHLVGMRMFPSGFHSPFATCRDELGTHHWRYFVAPIFLLYGIVGAIAEALALAPFIALGLANGLGGALYLASVWRLLRTAVPALAHNAFYLFVFIGGLGGWFFLIGLAAGWTNAPAFEEWFQRLAWYELIEGQHLAPALLLPRLYYTLPLALGFTALTELLITDAAGCRVHRAYAVVLLAVSAWLNVRSGVLIGVVGALFIVYGARGPIGKPALLVPWVCGAAAGAAGAIGVMALHPAYAKNVAGATQEAIRLIPLLTTAPWLLALALPTLLAVTRAAHPTTRRVLRGLLGYLTVYALLYLGYHVYYGNWLVGGDTSAAVFASDPALLGLLAAFVGKRSNASGDAPRLNWFAVWFLAFLVAGVSAWGQGAWLAWTPQRFMVLLPVPMAILAAHTLTQWPARRRMSSYAVALSSGAVSLVVGALFFQGHLGVASGGIATRDAPFGHLRYAHVLPQDAVAIQRIPPGGAVAVPGWTPIAMGEVVAQRGDIQVIGGPGALNLGGQPFAEVQNDVNTFFDATTDPVERVAFLDRWCVDYVFLPATAPPPGAVRAQLSDAPYLMETWAEGGAVLLAVRRQARRRRAPRPLARPPQ